MADFRQLAEHTVDVDLLPEKPWVLDVGCRGFQFDHELLKLRPKAFIFALDPHPEVNQPNNPSIMFFRTAMTEKETDSVLLQGEGDAASVVFGGQSCIEVANVTIQQVMKQFSSISRFDLVKLDCEGSEFGILENWPGPIATQISVEFHDFFDRKRWDDAYFQRLFDGPLRDYKPVLFGLSTVGPGSVGHWDCLLVQR